VTRFRGSRNAFGRPGIEPRWTQGSKDGVGTAYSGDSRVWFTIWNGCVTEVFYPTIDKAQVRDLQYLVSDGNALFHEEKRDLRSTTERISGSALAYRITNEDPAGRYSIVKDVIASPHLPCVLQRTLIAGQKRVLSRLRLYVLCAPHLQVSGWGNNAHVIEVEGRPLLVAEKGGVWLVVGATVPFARCSAGYVGFSDGWTDLAEDHQMDWEFDQALDGNVALTGELALCGGREFTLGLAFGDGLHAAVTTLLQALSVPFQTQASRYEEQWHRPCEKMLRLDAASSDGGRLYRSSYDLLLAHEDKIFAGALIASMAIPWGEARGDEDVGGYHLVWTRDLVNSATGLLAAGNTDTPLRALIYLAASQQEDGGFPQNFWVDGRPFWGGIQLDEVAFPIILAWRLHEERALSDFDPYSMVLRAAGYLVKHGPATQQERWEEASGYSPSTLASNIAALVCAALFARERGDVTTAELLEDYADFLECHVEEWTVTTKGTLHPEVKRHFVRVLPADTNNSQPDESPDRGILSIKNLPPLERRDYPAREIVDAGFLELVRYGIRAADDPTIVDSVRVVDVVLKVDTPVGPCWRRYNHDGYGQREDGGPFQGWGKGRAWPLLTGERAHYELSLGRDVSDLVSAMERFASPTGLLPEQVWDAEDHPPSHMYLGGPTGSAMPLMWAHAEYIKLLRSVRDGEVFDRVKAVAERYLHDRRSCRMLEIWKPNRQPPQMKRGFTLRIQAPGSFRLLYTLNDWKTENLVEAVKTSLGVGFVDIPVSASQTLSVRFTLYWPEKERWEGRDYTVRVV
jgi:glucoamylase